MQLKIYFGEKPLYLCDELNDDLLQLTQQPDTVFVDEMSSHAINAALHEIKKDEFNAGIIRSPDFETLKKTFLKHFKVIEAAGGVVQNADKDLLFIFRRGKWDLPKGKMEKNENPEVCAAREIEEETGVKGLILKNAIGDSYHVYDEYGKHILKISHWYFFTCNNDQQLQPQTAEDITEVIWIKTKDIKKPMSDTYATIKDILRIFFDSP